MVKVWKAVANGMDEICTRGRRVREDLNHPDWDGLPVLPEASPLKTMDRLEDVEGVVVTPSKESLPLVLEENTEGNIQETLEHPAEPYQECARCFRLFVFPTDWPVDPQPAEEDSELSSSSADSLTDDSVDTASEIEKVTAETLKAGCTK